MEDRLTDQPQKAVDSAPELADVAQCLCSILKQIQTVDTISESKNQTTGDDRRNQRCKNLCQRCDQTLKHVLVVLRHLLDSILRHTLNARFLDKIIVEIRDRVSDDNLKLTCLRKTALDDFHRLNR